MDALRAGAGDAERAAEYLIAGARALARDHSWQGRWQTPFHCDAAGPLVRRLAAERLYRVPRHAIEGLVAWAEGRPIELVVAKPSAWRVLELQARGSRCVSLLPEGASSAPHANGFEFAVHDLCHLGKFLDPERHEEQVGFFSTALRGFESERWRAVEHELDGAWQSDRDQVIADMNGSSVFLFAALKMKLKMAARRKAAARPGTELRTSGALTPAERAIFDELLEHMLVGFGFDPEVRAAAVETSARRDAPGAARLLMEHFRRAGALRLKESCSCPPAVPPRARAAVDRPRENDRPGP